MNLQKQLAYCFLYICLLTNSAIYGCCCVTKKHVYHMKMFGLCQANYMQLFVMHVTLFGLIGDDIEWMDAFNEASALGDFPSATVPFCHLLLFCEVNNPLSL